MTTARALNVLADAGRIRSPILPGMLTEDGLSDRGGRISDLHYAEAQRHGPARWGLSAHLDTRDPATVGCLLALLREAADDPSVHLAWVRLAEEDWVWVVVSSRPLHRGLPANGHTEGEVIASALSEMAAEVTP